MGKTTDSMKLLRWDNVSHSTLFDTSWLCGRNKNGWIGWIRKTWLCVTKFIANHILFCRPIATLWMTSDRSGGDYLGLLFCHSCSVVPMVGCRFLFSISSSLSSKRRRKIGLTLNCCSASPTVLLPQQTMRSSCWSSMFNEIRLEPTNKRCNSVYLQLNFLFVEKFTVIPFEYMKLFPVDHKSPWCFRKQYFLKTKKLERDFELGDPRQARKAKKK